jgi:hypothetical protein
MASLDRFIFFLFLLGVSNVEPPEVLAFLSCSPVAAIFAVKIFNPDFFFIFLLCCWVKLVCPEPSPSFF